MTALRFAPHPFLGVFGAACDGGNCQATVAIAQRAVMGALSLRSQIVEHAFTHGFQSITLALGARLSIAQYSTMPMRTSD
jgi:hypothetical protein